MTDKVQWADVTLRDVTGAQLGRARVPRTPFLPGILLWGKKYFRLTSEANTYLETECFLVPIERMYVARDKNAAPPEGAKT